MLRIPPETPVIGSIGRLESVKHYALALHAFARLQALNTGGDAPLLVLVGDGSERKALEALALTLGIAKRVRFLGWRDDAEALYGAFDLFTLTSRSEGTSISLLEAMSSGVCPIVTDVGGNRAVLGPALEALLVPTDDAPKLASAWQRYLWDPMTRGAMAIQARARVESEFSLGVMVERHAALYRALLRTAGSIGSASS
jgi:glycosyltransferase involved in cell wall biosynthesis